MPNTKAYAPPMGQADFRRIVETLFVRRPDGTDMVAVTPDIAFDADPYLDGLNSKNVLKINPDTDISGTPDGVPFCKFTALSPNGHLVTDGILYWDNETYRLRACVTDNPYAAVERRNKPHDLGIDACVAASRCCVRAAYPNCFPDAYPEDGIPIYVRRQIMVELSDNGYSWNERNVRLIWDGIRKNLDAKIKDIPLAAIDWMDFEYACLCDEND